MWSAARSPTCLAAPSSPSRRWVQPGHGSSRSGPYMKLYRTRCHADPNSSDIFTFSGMLVLPIRLSDALEFAQG
jgi:hypothetical protein